MTFEAWIALAFPETRPGGRGYLNAKSAWEAGGNLGNHDMFEAWIALAMPWLCREGSDYIAMHAAWDAGYQAAKDAENSLQSETIYIIKGDDQ